MGLKFDPLLEGELLARLEEWLAPRREEAKRNWLNRPGNRS
jgi:hypothetical protein